MPSTEQYLTYILDQLSDVPGVAVRPMMGEYLLYVSGKLVGGIYDDRLLLKPTDAARALLPPDAPTEKPYDGGGDMLLVEDTDDREILASVLLATAEALPPPKQKPKRRSENGSYYSNIPK